MQTLYTQGKSLRLTQVIFLLLASCLPFISVNHVHAQASAGITGTITDSTGAVIGNAKVSIADKGTSDVKVLMSSSSGTYEIKGINPGHYTITVEKAGYQKVVQQDVNVEVSLIDTVDIVMNAGSEAQTVQVTAPEIALNTTQPQIGSTLEPAVVAALPVEVSGRGRQIDSLQFTAPGVTGSTFSHRISGGVDFEQEILYNGLPVSQPETEGYTTNFDPPFEMVQEFRVERSTFAAQFGLGLGALTYQMQSGTNHYHGDLFEINRNSLFDSVGFFNSPAFTNNPKDTPPTDHENNYGFSVGGPLTIPHLYNGRDRTFGHYSQEWYKQNNLYTNPATVPTLAERAGDFTNYIDNSGNQIPIYDPTTGNQFSCNGVLNKICADRFSANSKLLLPYLPAPDLPGTGPAGQQNNRSAVRFPIPNIQHNWGFTIDEIATEKQSVHFSMWHNHFENYGFGNGLATPPNPLNSLVYYPNSGSGYLLTYNDSVTTNLAMTVGLGWIGETNFQIYELPGDTFNFPGAQASVQLPNITFDGQNAASSWSGANARSINRKLGLAATNNWLWTKGKQTFNIGGEARRAYQDDNEEQTALGQFNFSHNTTSQPGATPGTIGPNFNTAGSSFASYLLGVPDNANRTNSQELILRNFDLSPYVQDDIKFSPKLTVNVGVRWDIMVPFTENNNNIVFFNPAATSPYYANVSGTPIAGGASKFGTCTGCAGYDRAPTDFKHFGPRIGFAYELNKKSVIQAGFAVAFLNGGAYEYGTNKVAVNYGNLLVGSFKRNSTGTTQSSYGNWDTNILPNPPAQAFSPALGAGTQINAFSKKDNYAPYAQQWNVNYQRELPYNLYLQAAWLGNRIIHLPSNLNKIDQLDPKYLGLGSKLALSFNDGSAQAAGFTTPYKNFVNDFGGGATVAQALQPYPQYSYIMNNFEGAGTTYYQAAQVELDKRFTDGLAFLIGYTLSRQLDNTSSGFTSFANGGINKYNQKPEYVISSNNAPQVLKVSGTYELPIGPNKKYFSNRGVTGQLLGGWQVGWITQYNSGTPQGVSQNGTPFPNGFYRPLRVAGKPLTTYSYNNARKQFITGQPQQVYPTSCQAEISATEPQSSGCNFVDSPQYTLADTPRNFGSLKSAAFYDESLNARKKFFFGERFTGILQVDYFNAFNRTIFQTPDTNVDDSTFGQVTNASNAASLPNRQGQVSFRLEF